MKVFANVMIKNEALLLPVVYEYWKDYPIDHWVFYNDNSTDNTQEIIEKLFGSKATILNDKRDAFSESHNRSRMLGYSREAGADFCVSIDCDELMSTSLVENFEEILEANKVYDVKYYWFNVVNGTVKKIRNDPLYKNNYRTFVLSLPSTGSFDLTQYKYHTPRTPPVRLPPATTDSVGFIHLQAINKRFYALKQLWYKHFEYVTWNHSVEDINNKYDPVVNGLSFEEIDTPPSIVRGIEFDATIYDTIADNIGYKEFIEENFNEDLVTFGKEYLK